MTSRLLHRFGSLASVLAADRHELSRLLPKRTELLEHLGAVRNAMLHALAARMLDGPIIDNLTASADYLRLLFGDETAEQMWVLYLDVKARLITAELIGLGSTREAAVYPREIIRRSLEVGATTLILAHNHPSGDLSPSQSDIILTQRLIDAGVLLDLRVYDHIIVGRSGWTSLRTLGFLV